MSGTTPLFEHKSPAEKKHILSIDRYGTFLLPDAVRVGPEGCAPSEGYRIDKMRYSHCLYMRIAVSRECLADLFCDLMRCLYQKRITVSTTHPGNERTHTFQPVDDGKLEDILTDYKDVIENDGYTCFSINGLNPSNGGLRCELELEQCKEIGVYAAMRGDFREILHQYGLDRDQSMGFTSEAEHILLSSQRLADRSIQLSNKLRACSLQ